MKQDRVLPLKGGEEEFGVLFGDDPSITTNLYVVNMNFLLLQQLQ